MTPTNSEHFNLLTNPWIPHESLTGHISKVSLTDLLTNAHQIRRIATDNPLHTVAVTRLIEAILLRSLSLNHPHADPVELWEELWQAPTLTTTGAVEYLTNHHEHFWLRHPHTPFLQDPHVQLTSTEPLPLYKVVTDMPQNNHHMTQRSAASLTAIAADEAALTLLTAYAFNVSGTKSAVTDDPRVKNNRLYPMGVGAAGAIGGFYLEGDDLKATLLLNLVLESGGTSQLNPHDLPVWEQPLWQPTAETITDNTVENAPSPRGPVELLTWPSRRIRLIWNDTQQVTAAICTYASRINYNNAVRTFEWYSAWATKDSKDSPRTHQADVGVCRGLAAMLTQEGTSSGHAPQITTWLATLREEADLPDTLPFIVQATAPVYGKNDTVFADVVEESAPAHLAIATLQVRRTVTDAAALAEDTVAILASYASTLERAARGDLKDKARRAAAPRARHFAYQRFDEAFTQWLPTLTDPANTQTYLDTWYHHCHQIAHAARRDILDHSDPAALTGRRVKSGSTMTHLDAGVAENTLWSKLTKLLGPTPERTPSHA